MMFLAQRVTNVRSRYGSLRPRTQSVYAIGALEGSRALVEPVEVRKPTR
jgi:hypothetical protein